MNGHPLAARVRIRIEAERRAAEVLVGCVQAAIVLLFGGLYAAAPKTFSPDAAIEPVPWVLGGYLLFTLMRLFLAHRRALPRWLSAVSCVLDVGLLLGLIWTFHIQYEQPAAFVLKSPTLVYVFIFIALRALLLEPRLVILTGVAAAAGWLLVVAAVLVTDPRPGLVTRSYVDYLNSSSLLLGAELDKVVAILVVTILIGVAMRRAHRLLLRSVSDELRARDLARFFAPEVAERISGGVEIVPGRGEAREAAILYVDIRDFTGVAASIPPERLIALLADYQARLMPSILEHRGTAEKFLGDGMMAAFGAVIRDEAYAASALRAAEGILARIEGWNLEREARGEAPLAIGIAATAGRVVSGAVGGEARLEYAVVGQPVNLAAKLEKHAKVERARALCTAEAYERATAQGYRPAAPVDLRPQRVVAGVSEPLDLVVLAAWSSAEHRATGAPRLRPGAGGARPGPVRPVVHDHLTPEPGDGA